MQPRQITAFLTLILMPLAAIPLGHAETPIHRPILVGYFGQWGIYNTPPYTLRDLARSNQAARLDQIDYAQGFITGGHCSIADPKADLEHAFPASQSVNGRADNPAAPFRGHLHQLAELKWKYPRLKALISLEGPAASFALDAQPQNRQAFVASCIDLFLEGHLANRVNAPGLFDGIDIDWEYPQQADAANYLALLAEFRRQMDQLRPGLKLSVAVGVSPHMYPGTDLAAVAAQVDEFGIMTYDMAGPWMQRTGLIAPLYRVPPPSTPGPVQPSAPPPTGVHPTASTTPSSQNAMPAGSLPSSTPAPGQPPTGGVAGAVQAYLDAGVPAEKILLGIPFYGYGWTRVPILDNGLFQEGTPVHGDRPYSYIQSLIPRSTVYRDPVSKTPWLFDGDAFWTYDDPASLEAKAAFAVDHNLGGIMIWELSEDTPGAALLMAAHRALLNASTASQNRLEDGTVDDNDAAVTH